MRRMRCFAIASRVSTARSRAHERLPASRPWEEAKRVQVEPELPGAPVHLPHEAPLGAGYVLGERYRRIVARHHQQAVEQRLEPHAPAAREHPDRLAAGSAARPRVIRTGSFGRVRSTTSSAVMIFVRLAIGTAPQRSPAPEHLAAANVEDEPGPRRLAQLDLEGVGAGQRHVRHRLGGHEREPAPAAPTRPVGAGGEPAAIGAADVAREPSSLPKVR